LCREAIQLKRARRVDVDCFAAIAEVYVTNKFTEPKLVDLCRDMLLVQQELWWWEDEARKKTKQVQDMIAQGDMPQFYYLYQSPLGALMLGWTMAGIGVLPVAIANLMNCIQTSLGRAKVQVTSTHFEELVLNYLMLADSSVGKTVLTTTMQKIISQVSKNV
jgi:hypothetical protein